MKFRDFLIQLSPEELEAYAIRAGTTPGYLMTHLLYGYKEPRKKLRKALAAESNGQVSEMDVLEHFGFASASETNQVVQATT
ncbi:hypothetical protein [Alkanindiges illinoisensis]|uniref:XRE family transcriptional regulator n=1 Tax=Alkanindiges illinoisensis TaxID=197183 RepID=A0A4Y7XES5_9GAMM|nr:hypothetical protein [Alkanindiges illinoisensis]TEU30106.1 hypothetical protein E2B99_03440 [Alkanindiges illinoisensis]